MTTFKQFCEAKARLDPEGHELYGKQSLPPLPPQSGRRNAKLVGAEDHELYGKEAPAVAVTPQDVRQSIQPPVQDYKARLLKVIDRQIQMSQGSSRTAKLLRKLVEQEPGEANLQGTFAKFKLLLHQVTQGNLAGMEYVAKFLNQLPADLLR